jgi:hypothetical protein
MVDQTLSSSRRHRILRSQSLDAETRIFFLQVYERHPDLNIAEQRLLARSARVGTDVVESFCKSRVSPTCYSQHGPFLSIMIESFLLGPRLLWRSTLPLAI